MRRGSILGWELSLVSGKGIGYAESGKTRFGKGVLCMKSMDYEQVKTRVEAEDKALKWLVPWLGLAMLIGTLAAGFLFR